MDKLKKNLSSIIYQLEQPLFGSTESLILHLDASGLSCQPVLASEENHTPTREKSGTNSMKYWKTKIIHIYGERWYKKQEGDSGKQKKWRRNIS